MTALVTASGTIARTAARAIDRAVRLSKAQSARRGGIAGVGLLLACLRGVLRAYGGSGITARLNRHERRPRNASSMVICTRTTPGTGNILGPLDARAGASRPLRRMPGDGHTVPSER